jgi:hypothetical protein
MTSGDFHDVPRTSETALTIDLSLVGGTNFAMANAKST